MILDSITNLNINSQFDSRFDLKANGRFAVPICKAHLKSFESGYFFGYAFCQINATECIVFLVFSENPLSSAELIYEILLIEFSAQHGTSDSSKIHCHHRHRSSVNFGARHFCPKICV